MGQESERLQPFSHTSNSCYLTALFALCCIGYDSTHDVIERSHINRKWFYLFGATCLFAYLYVRPLIRRRLGSASRGYINWSTIYISWLLIAVFYHLPSLESMGINIKADVSMWLACFLGTLCTLGTLHALYGLLVALRALDPRLYSPLGGPREAWATVLMNSVSLAVACSAHYSFCGNAPPGSLAGSGWKEAVCHRWLHPVSAASHSAFTRWVIYGEPAGANGTAPAPPPPPGAPAGRLWRGAPPPPPLAPNSSGVPHLGLPLDGAGPLPVAAADLVSPVFTLWLTLLLMYGANCLADYAAAATLNAACTADMRRGAAHRQRGARRHQRRRSADAAHDLRRGASWASAGSGATASDAGGSVREALSNLAARGSFDALLRTVSSVGHLLGSPAGTVRRAGSALFRDDFGVGLATGWLAAHQGGAPAEPAGGCVPLPADAAAPSFAPMFPWYSGTSADLLHTLLDLLISVRLFLGRFDMRTLQAATAPRPPGPDAPAAGGDGFTFEHLAAREEAWWDFVADTGDGGDPTYAIARCLAAPQLSVTVPPEVAAAGAAGCGPEARAAASLAAGRRTLPRADLVCHGGDLCYPSPSDESFEQRLFGPYQDAFPPPAHVHPGHLVIRKPDLGPEHWAAAPGDGCRCGGGAPACARHRAAPEQAARPCRACAKEAALRAYAGPSLFAIPGNHDWLDGLDGFQAHITHRGWLGGWLLPQEKSYWALRLPHGWWVLGLDTALGDDIDMCQYSYFARLAEERMGPDDSVVLVQHQPAWLVDWFWGRASGSNIRQLVRGPLAGRARLRLAGDLHFSMRHSFRPYGPGQSPSLAPSGLATPAGGSPLGGSPLGGSPASSRRSSRAATPAPGLHRQPSPAQLHQSLVSRLGSGGGAAGLAGLAVPAVPAGAPDAGGALAPCGASPKASPPPGSSPKAAWSLGAANGGGPAHPLPEAAAALAGTLGSPPEASRPVTIAARLAAAGGPVAAAGGEGLPPLHAGRPAGGAAALGASPPSGPGSPFHAWWPGVRARTASASGLDAAGGAAPAVDAAGGRGVRRCSSDAGLAGGSGAASDAWGSAAASLAGGGAPGGPPPGWHLCDPEHLVVCGGGGGFCHPTHVFAEARFRPEHQPAAGPLYVRAGGVAGRRPSPSPSPSSASLHSLARGAEPGGGRPAGGEYRCEAAFPTPRQSRRLARANLTFRSVNNRFDVVGGLLYYLLVVSVLPRCTGVAGVLEAGTLREAAAAFARAGLDAVGAVLTESYVSLAALLAVFGILLGLCRSGGIGAQPGLPSPLRRRPELHGSPLAVRARLGGGATQVAYAAAHCGAHLATAVSLLLLLELAIEVMVRYEGVGRDGYHSLYKWYRAFERQHFPDPMGVRDLLARATLGLYPRALKWAMAAFDVPEAIAVGRTAMCAGAGLTRLQAAAYYLGVLAYYWLLATPAVGFVFGAYLYISVAWFHAHYDEAFSSLQVPHFKGFLRLHVTRGGDLELFGLALERVPHAWREDPRWRAPAGGGGRDVPAHRAKFPSRWVPVEERPHLLRPPRMVPPPEAQLQVVDYLLVPRYRVRA